MTRLSMPAPAPMAPAADRFGDWIQTFTGRKFWPFDPRTDEVDVRDIAHALSLICRFTGHVREFYSVAQHSVIASRVVPPQYALLALLHDAAEAYMGNISRPVKRRLCVDLDVQYLSAKAAEKALLAVILKGLPIPWDWYGDGPGSADAWAAVDRADVLLLVTEARDLMHQPLADGWHHRPDHGFDVLPEPIIPQPPAEAERNFLARFKELSS